MLRIINKLAKVSLTNTWRGDTDPSCVPGVIGIVALIIFGSCNHTVPSSMKLKIV